MTKTMNKKRKIGVVVSQFNEFITRRLLKGCLSALRENGIAQTDITIVEVPGAFELPLAALKLAKIKKIKAVIALGAVIRGETYHFELVAQNAAAGILKVGLQTGKPVIFGVLTTDTVKQAYARSQLKGENKGRDAAEAALKMMGVCEVI